MACFSDYHAMKNILRRTPRNDRGATMVEYGLLVALIAVISVPAMMMVGHRTERTFNRVGESLVTAEAESEGGANASDTSSPGSDESESSDSADDSTASSDTNSDDDTSNQNQEESTQDDLGDNLGDTGDDFADSGDSDSEGDASAAAATTIILSETSDLDWWNDTKHGGEGAWVASFEFQNDWIRHQYLTLEVSSTDHNGKKSTFTVSNFYVPAGGTATYQAWDNDLELKNKKTMGVMSVEVKVVSITTSDENWEQVSYQVESPTSASVSHPSV
jgi:pilus assembly protein Flp/PilA